MSSYRDFFDSPEKTSAETRDKWINDGRLDDLIEYIHEDYDSGQWDNFFQPLVDRLIEKQDLRRFKKFWKGLLRYRIEDVWDWYKDWNNKNEYWDGKEKTLEAQKYALEGIEHYISDLRKFDSKDDLDDAFRLKESITALKKPKAKFALDKRKIDETVFWELIKLNREKSSSKAEFIEQLTKQLQGFKPAEIKRFENILRSKMEILNDWAVWALAFIVRKGCGDDEFEYFKAWVVSKGYSVFKIVQEQRLGDLKSVFDEDPQLEDMLYVAENAFEERTGKIMKPMKFKTSKMKGVEWQEENLNTDFEELCSIFNH